MTSHPNRFVFACLSIAGTVGLVSFSNPAAAAIPVGQARQTSIATADLDLGSAAGRATFERRLNAAVERVCSQPSREAVALEAPCRRDVVAQAYRQVGIDDDRSS